MSINNIMETVKILFDSIVEILLNIDLPENFLFHASIVIIIGIWLGFALWAARSATQAKRSRLKHFLLSLVLPVVYPLMLPGILRKKRRREWAQAKQEEEEKRQRKIALTEANRRRMIGGKKQEREKEEETRESAEIADAEPQTPRQEGRESAPDAGKENTMSLFFKQMLEEQKKDKTERKLRITYAENEITAEQILEVLPQLVVVRTRAHDREKKPQSLRVPLNRITKIEKQEADGAWQEIDPEFYYDYRGS